MPTEEAIRARRGWSRNTARRQLFTFTEAERYEMLVELEGRRIAIDYGRTSDAFARIVCTLVYVAYPLDTLKKDPPSTLVVLDEHDCPRTIKSSSIRTIEVFDD